MECGRILIVSDNPELRCALGECFTRSGVPAQIISTCTLWQMKPKSESVRGIVLDTTESTLAEPGNVSEFAGMCSSLPVLVLTAAGDVPTAVHAIRHGAKEVIQKPVQLARVVDQILRMVVVHSQ